MTDTKTVPDTDEWNEHILFLEEMIRQGADNEVTRKHFRIVMEMRKATWGMGALVTELWGEYLDAIQQGQGTPYNSPTWHHFMSTYEDADANIPVYRARIKALGLDAGEPFENEPEVTNDD